MINFVQLKYNNNANTKYLILLLMVTAITFQINAEKYTLHF